MHGESCINQETAQDINTKHKRLQMTRVKSSERMYILDKSFCKKQSYNITKIMKAGTLNTVDMLENVHKQSQLVTPKSRPSQFLSPPAKITDPSPCRDSLGSPASGFISLQFQPPFRKLHSGLLASREPRPST